MNRARFLEENPEYMKNYFIENADRYSRSARKARKEQREESVCND